jgi:hypothetical protein
MHLKCKQSFSIYIKYCLVKIIKIIFSKNNILKNKLNLLKIIQTVLLSIGCYL